MSSFFYTVSKRLTRQLLVLLLLPFSVLANNPHSKIGDTKHKEVSGLAVADYTITTTGGNMVITDVSGNGETLTVSESGSNIRFSVPGRTYQIDAGAITAFNTTPADIALTGKTSITINMAAGTDIINVGAFSANLPSLTINGGTGDDVVNFNGDITFSANSHLNVDLQNDDATPGIDAVTIAANANLLLSGTGTATLKVSKNVTVNAGGSLQTANGNLTVEANRQATPTNGAFIGVNNAGLLQVTGSGTGFIKGTGGTGTNFQYGVVVSNGGDIIGGTGGTLTVEGTGGAGAGTDNYGVYLVSAGTTITSTGGNVSVTGWGGEVSGVSRYNYGVYLLTGGTISAGGNGTVTVYGTGAVLPTGNSTHGVYVTPACTITSSGGNVTVTGYGGGSGAAGANYGVLVSGTISAGSSGTVTVQGTGSSTSTGSANDGVAVGGGGLITSSGGNVSVTGLGSGSGSGSGHGVNVQTSGIITAGANGTVTVQGTGGGTTASTNSSIGVVVSNDGTITSNGGNVNVSGQGGMALNTASLCVGVYLREGIITAGGNGNVNVQGTGGTNGDSNHGVYVFFNSTSGITSSGGNVSVTGQAGGTGSNTLCMGIELRSNGYISAGGNGTVTLHGSGGTTAGHPSYGINCLSGLITSGGGNISVTGLKGVDDSSLGISLSSSNGITTSDNGGNITLIADRVSLSAPISTKAAGSTTLRPYTNGLAINLGSGSSGLTLSDADLDYVSTGTLIIGDANSGAITVSADITRSAATDVELISGGNVILSGGGFNTGGGTLFLDPGTTPAAVKPTFNGTDVTASTLSFGSDLALVINGTTPGTQYDQLKVAGIVDLSGVNLKLSGTPSPALAGGEIFTIVDNDGSEAITGTFTSLSQGATISNFLGSGLNATISYIGGTGNDVVITVNAASLPDFTLTKATSSTFIQGGTASYNLTVNNIGTASSVGTYTITDPLPSGLTIQSVVAGAAWNCTSSTPTQVNCISNTAISSGSSAGVVTVNVNIAGNAPASITNTASVWGGGETNTANNTGSVTSAVTGLPNYTITTTGNIVTLTDVSGNGETLTISENGGDINFNVTGRTYSLDGGAVTNFPADVPLSGKTGIVLNTANGADIINVGAFTANLPSLTVNGGTGNDAVNFNGDITFASNASLDVDLQNDDVNPGVDAVTIAANANLLLSGTGTATVKVSKNVLVRGSLETVNGNLVMEANQQATPTAGSFNGVDVINAGGLLQSTGSGSVTIKGKGGDDAGGSQFGVRLILGSKINGGTGSLTVTGTGGNSEGNYNHGVHLHSSLITSSGGNVTVTGTGAGSGANIASHGVLVNVASQITAGGMGSVTVTGNGGSAATGGNNIGVLVQAPDSRITSSGGNVSVTGSGGGSASSATNAGVAVGSAGQITAGGIGTVTVTGTGGATSGNENHGVAVYHDNSLITSTGGNVTVTGLGGGSGASSKNNGIIMAAGGRITAGSTGTVTLTGTGGPSSGNENIGILVSPTSQITSSGGNMSVTGKEGGGLSGYGIATQNSSSITTATNGGNITLIANSMDIQSGPISTNTGGTLTMRPFTTNTAINLGSSTNTIGGPLSLSDAELDVVSAGTLIIGDATCGAITVSAAITLPTATNVQLISGDDVSLSGGGFNTNGGTLLLDPGNSPAAVKPTFNGTDVTASTLSFGSDLAIAINGTTPATQYDQLKVVGALNLTGVSLKLSGTPSPALTGGEIFTIVDNDDNETITGTFTGLAQGATINNFLGSGLNATITYSGGSGNDVVLSVACPSIQAPTASVTAQPTCTTPTGTIVVTAPTGADIQYSLGDAYQASATFAGLTPNSYNVTAKNTTTGCISTALSLTINTVPANPATPTASVTAQPSCTTPTGTIIVTAPTGADIQYSVGGTYQASTTFAGLTANTYQVTAKNTTTGCVSTALPLTINAVPNAPATPTASVTSQPSCTTPTGTIIVTAPTGSTIHYSIGGEYQPSATFSGLAPTTYSVTAKNTVTGCISVPLSLTVNPSASSFTLSFLSKIHPTTCQGSNGSLTFTTNGLPNGSYTLNYSDGAPKTVTVTINSNQFTLSGLRAGSYTNFSLTNAECTGSDTSTQTLSDPAAPNAGTISGAQPICGTYTLQLTSNGDAGGTWSSADVNIATVNPTTGVVTGVGSGQVQILYRVLNGECSSSTSVLIRVSALPALTATGTLLPNSRCPSLEPVPFNSSVSCGGGKAVVWYSSATGNSPISLPSQTPLMSVDYYAACNDLASNCESSERLKMSFTALPVGTTLSNVSLKADAATIVQGQSASVCDLPGTALTFNANCGPGQMLLFSVDGAAYSSVVPSQIVDGNLHNYRLRCQAGAGVETCLGPISEPISLRIYLIPAKPTVSLSPAGLCSTAPSVTFGGSSSCGSSVTLWFNANSNTQLASLPAQTPLTTTSYYAKCQNVGGCLSEPSDVVTFTVLPVRDAPIVTTSGSDELCTGTSTSLTTNCPAGSTVIWNTAYVGPTLVLASSTPHSEGYSAKCFLEGCETPMSPPKVITWSAFALTVINIGQSQSGIKSVNDKAAWSSQFVTPDAGPSLQKSTQLNPTLYYTENPNKTGPRYWTIQVETCNLGTDGSVTYDLLATPEVGAPQSFNTHENNAPYLMYANREGFTELYAQNHPAYGFYQSNGSGGNTYDAGLPKGLYKLSIRYWDMKGYGSIYPATRQPQGNVLAYQEYWFRIQSQNGIGTGASRIGSESTEGGFAQVAPNPVSHTLRLKISEAKGRKVSTGLIDASGRTLLQRAFVPQTDQHQEEFEVSHLANGMYFLQVKTADKQTTLKVVKVQ